MPKIKIDIDEKISLITLSGDTAELYTNRRIRFFLVDSLKADLSSKDKIIIPFNPEDLEKIVLEIQESFERFNIIQDSSTNTKTILKDFFREEENFKVFSNKALSIRNNELNPLEFKDFTKIVEEKLTNRILYPLQLLSSYHLAFSQNACNFSVPGAGKTSIVYAAFAYLNSLQHDNPKFVDKILVIGPLSSFGPWEIEYFSCFGQKPDSMRLSGNLDYAARRDYFYSSYTKILSMISYQSIVSNLNDIIFFLTNNRVMVVLDEAHRIKNVEGGVWAQSVLSLSRYSSARVVLTGTPAPNGYEDLYNLFSFIWPNKNLTDFYLYQLKEMSSVRGDPRIQTLVNNLSPYFIRIRKRDLKLPEPIETNPIYIPMGNIQSQIYDFIENSYLTYFLSINDDQGFRDMMARARMIRLMQAASNPSLLRRPLDVFLQDEGMPNNLFIDDRQVINSILNYDTNEIPTKFIRAKTLIEQILSVNQKVVVWAVFIDTIKSFQEFLNKYGINSKVLIGETPIESSSINEDSIETRESIIRDFHKQDSEFKVLIANPFAVSESISLHKACHNAIYLERTFNAANFVQSKDRIHRVGLTPDDKITYYYLLTENTIERTIHDRLNEKVMRMIGVIEAEEIPLINMNMDYEEDSTSDIKAIIRDYVSKSSKI